MFVDDLDKKICTMHQQEHYVSRTDIYDKTFETSAIKLKFFSQII